MFNFLSTNFFYTNTLYFETDGYFYVVDKPIESDLYGSILWFILLLWLLRQYLVRFVNWNMNLTKMYHSLPFLYILVIIKKSCSHYFSIQVTWKKARGTRCVLDVVSFPGEGVDSVSRWMAEDFDAPRRLYILCSVEHTGYCYSYWQ